MQDIHSSHTQPWQSTTVLERLDAFALIHLQSDHGSLYGLSDRVSERLGIDPQALHPGRTVYVQIEQPFARIVAISLTDPDRAQPCGYLSTTTKHY